MNTELSVVLKFLYYNGEQAPTPPGSEAIKSKILANIRNGFPDNYAAHDGLWWYITSVHHIHEMMQVCVTVLVDPSQGDIIKLARLVCEDWLHEPYDLARMDRRITDLKNALDGKQKEMILPSRNEAESDFETAMQLATQIFNLNGKQKGLTREHVEWLHEIALRANAYMENVIEFANMKSTMSEVADAIQYLRKVRVERPDTN